MLSTKPWFTNNKKKGFTLVELILTLAVASLVVVPLISILILSTKACSLAEERDELMLNGNYALEYIKNEIKSGDKIIVSSKITGLVSKYPTNIGFVIMIEDDDKDIYSTYHTKDNKLIRIGCETAKGKYCNQKYPGQSMLKGFNSLCEFINRIDKSKLDLENSIINLNLELEGKNKTKLELKSDIYIRCEIDY